MPSELKNRLVKKAVELMAPMSFDTLGVGIIDFNQNSYDGFEIHSKKDVSELTDLYFDLASITKALTLASCYIVYPKYFTKEMELLLNHRSGIIAWGLLAKENWRELLLSYQIKESPTIYSDFGALRLMLEIEQRSKKDIYQLMSSLWDEEIKSWLDLEKNNKCVETGYRLGKRICGEVHDPNAWVLEEKVAHAGLFGTVRGLCKTFLSLNKESNLLEKLKKWGSEVAHERFLFGWDTISGEDSLAGAGAGRFTFGHLGFTGNSIWMDPEKAYGIVILSNSTQEFWYSKHEINTIRKSLGKLFWESFK